MTKDLFAGLKLETATASIGRGKKAGQRIPMRVDGFLPANSAVVIAAQPKAGKTTTMMNLLKSLADGSPFLGEKKVHPRTCERCGRVPNPGLKGTDDECECSYADDVTDDTNGNILFVDTEMEEHEYDAQVSLMGIKHPERIIRLSLLGDAAKAFDLTQKFVKDEDGNEVRETVTDGEETYYSDPMGQWVRKILDNNIGTVVLDAVGNVLVAHKINENSPTEVSDFTNQISTLMRMVREWDVSPYSEETMTLPNGEEYVSNNEDWKPKFRTLEFVLVHHMGKDAGAGARGANRWDSWPSMFIRLLNEKGVRKLVLAGRTVGIKFDEPRRLKLDIETMELSYSDARPPVVDKSAELSDLQDAIVRFLKENPNVSKASIETGMVGIASRDTVRSALSVLVDAKRVEVVRDGARYLHRAV